MPTQITRVNPLDLQKNIAIGVALPFGKIDMSLPDPVISGSFLTGQGVFRSTYSTQDQIKSNLINLILTNKGERVFNPLFGSNIKKTLFENITEDLTDLINQLINDAVNTFMPEIEVRKVDVTTDEYNPNLISITITYIIKISNIFDQVTVEFI